MGEIIDKVKEKVKDVKDKVLDTTKDVAKKTKETVDSSVKTSLNSNGREFEEGAAGTNKGRKGDPLTEYSDKEPMTPAKLKIGEPTAVKRDPGDQKITSEEKTGTNTPEAQEEYRKRGMTKIEKNSSHDQANN